MQWKFGISSLQILWVGQCDIPVFHREFADDYAEAEAKAGKGLCLDQELSSLTPLVGWQEEHQACKKNSASAIIIILLVAKTQNP